ncbi:MAG TPA: MlaD family protein, partial [Mycobacterium sp.]|nr:MlaD family protein [Mycobacterium sp.]
MHFTRRIKIQLAMFTVIAVAGMAVTAFGWMGLPDMLFGVGHYTVTLELPEAAGLYPRANVTYRGTEVGQVKDVRIAGSEVEAELSLKSGIAIPSDLRAEVHSQTAVGEQFVALLPQNSTSAPLRNGEVIPVSKASVPPDINSLLDATNRGLLAIPHDNLRTVIDEADTAVGGLGPELSRIVKGSSQLAADARHDLDALTTLIDTSPAVLDTQAHTSDAITAWAAHLATITDQVRSHDDAVTGILTHGPDAANQVGELFERLQPSLPILLANMVSLGQVALVYQANIEQLLVLVPQGTQNQQAVGVANR